MTARPYSKRVIPPPPSALRRFDHAKGRTVTLSADHAAVREARTLFPHSVRFVEETGRVLKSGHNSRKVGKTVMKGKWRGFPIFTLTLEERRTCPSTCQHWLSCYGNNMHFAERMHHDADFEDILWLELEALNRKYPRGYVVRLHVLGDFYSEAYVGLWERALDQFSALHVFGYTARDLESRIGKRLYDLASRRFDRFALRFSGQDWRTLASPTVERGVRHPVALTCPAQTGRTECCATCGLCWATRRSVAFERHGTDPEIGDRRRAFFARLAVTTGRGRVAAAAKSVGRTPAWGYQQISAAKAQGEYQDVVGPA